jgi:hypothetical protein
MWDWSFGVPGFGSFFGNAAVPPAGGGGGVASSGQPQAGTQTTSYPAGTPWWQVLLTSGLDAFKSYNNTDIAETQIAAGQYPSQNAIVPNLNAATSTLTSFLLILVILIIVFAVGRFALGGRRR